MDLTFFVNRVSVHPRDVSVPFKGEMAMMKMAETEVELVDLAGVHGTMTLHFSGTSEMDMAKKFTAGSVVTIPIDAFSVASQEAPADPVEAEAAA